MPTSRGRQLGGGQPGGGPPRQGPLGGFGPGGNGPPPPPPPGIPIGGWPPGGWGPLGPPDGNPQGLGNPQDAINHIRINDAKKASTIKFDPVPHAKGNRQWNLAFKKEVASSSTEPNKAFEWIHAIESLTEQQVVDQDQNSKSFITHNAKIASGLTDIFTGEFRR